MDIAIRSLDAEDINAMSSAFVATGWQNPKPRFCRYLADQEEGLRVTLVAFADGAFAGYLNVVWLPDYPPFREGGIPEIQDFNVVSTFWRRGIGTRMMDAAETLIASRSAVAGIGVGMTADYGAAQRLYVRRGYVPDGRGLVFHNRFLSCGEQVLVDDDLVLHFTKTLSLGTKNAQNRL